MWLTVNEYAKRNNISPQYVYRQVKQKKLKTMKNNQNNILVYYSIDEPINKPVETLVDDTAENAHLKNQIMTLNSFFMEYKTKTESEILGLNRIIEAKEEIIARQDKNIADLKEEIKELKNKKLSFFSLFRI